jgi:translation elongation factor EF-G
MEQYLEGEEITASELRQALRGATLQAHLVPVLCGAALGIRESNRFWKPL